MWSVLYSVPFDLIKNLKARRVSLRSIRWARGARGRMANQPFVPGKVRLMPRLVRRIPFTLCLLIIITFCEIAWSGRCTFLFDRDRTVPNIWRLSQIAFTERVIRALKDNLCVDENRIYAAGKSNVHHPPPSNFLTCLISTSRVVAL
jgi:hypothetical protein